MSVSEQQWMAYVDGELDAAAAARVEAAMREDRELAAKVAAQQRLRARLQREWTPVLDEPVPQRLAAALRARPRRDRPPVWLAAAASLLLGVLAASWWYATPRQALQLTDGALVAHGVLDEALTRRLTVDPALDGVDTGLSFRSRAGDYCRSFVLSGQSLAGLACRRADGWQVVALGAVQARGDGLRQASSGLPPAVLAEVDARLQGEPLDAEGERRARDAGWRGGSSASGE